MLIEPVIPYRPVITFDIGILLGMARLYVLQSDFVFLRPALKGMTDILRSIVTADVFRLAPLLSNDAIKCTSEIDRSIGYNGFSFSRSLADDKQIVYT